MPNRVSRVQSNGMDLTINKPLSRHLLRYRFQAAPYVLTVKLTQRPRVAQPIELLARTMFAQAAM